MGELAGGAREQERGRGAYIFWPRTIGAPTRRPIRLARHSLTALFSTTGNRPANTPAHRLTFVALHNIFDPPLDQHSRFQAASLRGASPLLRLRSLPGPTRARERACLNSHATRQSLPQPLRRQRNRRKATRIRALPEDCCWPSALANRKSCTRWLRTG